MFHSFCLFSILLVLGPELSLQKQTIESSQQLLRKDKSENEKIVVCYFTNWALYRSGAAKYTPENINASLCTHINYAFAVLDTKTLTMVPDKPYADIENSTIAMFVEFFELVTALKEFGVKVLLTIGGWNNSVPDHWSRLVSNATARAVFIASVLDLLEKYHFVGLDMDYEYPGCPQGDKSAGLPNDKENFNLLMTELKQAFAGKYLLTIVTDGNKHNIDECYDMKPLCELCDWVNVLNYDYYSCLDGESGPNAPYHGTGSKFGVYETIDHYIHSLGCPAEKLVLGLPFFGKSYSLADPSTPQFGAPITGPGEAGPYTESPGYLAYYEIFEYVKNGYNVGHNQVNGSFAWNNNQFISFDSVSSIVKKSGYVKQFGLRGAMVWSLDYDDFNNICGCGSYPLLNTVNHQLGRASSPITCL